MDFQTPHPERQQQIVMIVEGNEEKWQEKKKEREREGLQRACAAARLAPSSMCWIVATPHLISWASSLSNEPLQTR